MAKRLAPGLARGRIGKGSNTVMARIALVYGSISGLIIITSMIISFVLTKGEHGDASLFTGYLIMIVALSMIFVGVKQHRDGALGGVIKFGPAFLLGLFIALVAGLAYVLVWEAYLALTHYSFAESYATSMIEAKRAEGVSGAALEAEIAKARDFTTQYANPLFRVPMTFLEIFPVGLLIALISAAVLRNPRVLPKRA
jgi:Protein of unknown function (DUF4199)